MAELVDFSEILLADLGGMLTKISASIGAAQRELDQSALASQANLEREHEELAKVGYRVPWYVIPEATVELKVAVHLEEKTEENGTKKARWFFSPYNAKYQNAYSFVADGASTVKIRITPLPSPVIEEPK